MKNTEKIWETFSSTATSYALPHVANANTMIELWFEDNEQGKAQKPLDKLHLAFQGQDAIDAAILANRLGNHRRAHDYFEKAGDLGLGNSRALHEFAQTKIRLATETRERRPGLWRETHRKCGWIPGSNRNASGKWKQHLSALPGPGGTLPAH